MARTKKTVLTNITLEDCDIAFAQYANLDAEMAKLIADMDAQCTLIREQNAGLIANLETAKNKAFEIIQTYATENKELLFSKKKSVQSVHGVFGFRTSTPKLQTIKGHTWTSVVNLLQTSYPQYLRMVKPEPAKDLLLSDRKTLESTFPKLGLTVVQDETFYIDPRK